MLYNGKARVSNTYNPKNGHYGIDIVGQGDKKIYSPVDGVVIACGNTDPNGWGINVQIKLNSNPKYRMVIGHFNKIGVKNGQTIKKGDYLGDEGWTGYTIPKGSGGQHSHTEVRLIGGDRNTTVNPLSYLGLTDNDNKVGTIIDFTKVNQKEVLKKEEVKTEKVLDAEAEYEITGIKKKVVSSKLTSEKANLEKLGYTVTTKVTKSATYKFVTVPTVTHTFKKGDTVTVKKDAKTYAGGGLASWLTTDNFKRKVIDVDGDRIVVGDDKGNITAAIKATDLTKR